MVQTVAIAFCIVAVIAVVGMFLTWLIIDHSRISKRFDHHSEREERAEAREDLREAREYELAKARLLIESGLIPNQSAHAPVSAAEQLRLENLENQMLRIGNLLESGLKKPTAVYVNYTPGQNHGGQQVALLENGQPLRRLSV